MEYKEAMYILGLKDGFSEAEEKKAYKNMAMRCHPDQGGTDGLFSIVNEAHTILSNSTAATQKLKREEPKPSPRREPWKPSWSDLPWDQIFLTESEYIKLVLEGKTIEKLWSDGTRYGYYQIKIQPRDLSTTQIRAHVPVTGRITQWNWRHLFTPEICKLSGIVKNSPFNVTKFNFRVSNLSPGLHKIWVSILGVDKEFWFFCGKKSKTVQKWFSIYGEKTVYVGVTLTTEE